MLHKVDPNDAYTQELNPLYVITRFALLLTPDVTPPFIKVLIAVIIKKFTER